MREAEEVMKRALWTSNDSFNRSICPTTRFSTGNLVYIEGTNIKTMHPSNKLAQCWYNPFEVLCQMNETSYELKLLDTWCLKHPVFHQNLLSKHHMGHSPQQLAKPRNPAPSLDESGEEVYNVETVINSWKAGRAKGGIEYLIKWLDYGEEKNTWEPGSTLDNSRVQDLIKLFHTKHPNTFHPGGAGRWGHQPLNGGVILWDHIVRPLLSALSPFVPPHPSHTVAYVTILRDALFYIPLCLLLFGPPLHILLPIAPPRSPTIIFFVVGEQVCALILLYLLA